MNGFIVMTALVAFGILAFLLVPIKRSPRQAEKTPAHQPIAASQVAMKVYVDGALGNVTVSGNSFGSASAPQTEQQTTSVGG